MPKKSREAIVMELELDGIRYDESMSYSELLALRQKSESIEKPEDNLMVPDVPFEKSTIQDHEQRLCVLEQQVAMIKEMTNAGGHL